MVLLASAGCEGDPSGPPTLSAIRVQGTVSSTVGAEPIVDMVVGLGWDTAGGLGQKTTRTDAQGRYAVILENVACAPGAYAIIGVIPDGYRLFLPDGEDPSVQCTEEIQTFDILLEPTSD